MSHLMLRALIDAQVLHMDRNNYYGGESASLNLNQVRSLLTTAGVRRWCAAGVSR